MPKVSICIPTYNYGHLITDAIKSVLLQEYEDYELIICDNASTDGTEDVVKSFKDPRIRYIKNSNNFGFTQNLNIGLKLASGEYIVYLCADDYWLPGLLEEEVKILDAHPDVVMVHTGYKSVYRIGGQDIIRKNALLWPSGISDGKEMVKYFFNNYATFVWPMVKRDVVQRLSGFDVRMTAAPESHMWLRTALEGKVAYIAEPLYAFRYHGDNLGVEVQKKGNMIEELLMFSDDLLIYIKNKDEDLFSELRTIIHNFAFRESYRWLLHSRTFMGSTYRELLKNSVRIVRKRPQKMIYPFENAIRISLSFLPRPILRLLSSVKNRLVK